MSKEYLEALEQVKTLRGFNDIELGNDKNITKSLDIIEQALHRLDSIDNANPSEALEAVKQIEFYVGTIIGLKFVKGDNVFSEAKKQDYEIFERKCNIIKQALLKAQEPKQYLKWEDLEFKIFDQEISVLLNGNKYSLKYYTYDIGDMAYLYKENRNIFVFDGRCSEDKQFFNDLHLERVEE